MGNMDGKMHPSGKQPILRLNGMMSNHAQVPFWVAATIVDIIIDVAIIMVSACTVWSLRIEYHRKPLVTVILSLRLL